MKLHQHLKRGAKKLKPHQGDLFYRDSEGDLCGCALGAIAWSAVLTNDQKAEIRKLGKTHVMPVSFEDEVLIQLKDQLGTGRKATRQEIESTALYPSGTVYSGNNLDDLIYKINDRRSRADSLAWLIQRDL